MPVVFNHGPEMSAVEAICQAVNAERDRRIDGGFPHLGHVFQSRPSDRENIMAKAFAAQRAIDVGAQPGDLRWESADYDFAWIVEDNTFVPLDAFQMVGVMAAGVAFKTALTFHAHGLKETVKAAEDPTSIDITSGWPA